MGGGMGDRGASFGEELHTCTQTQSRTNGYTDRPRYGDREQLPLPSKPPYTAHLGNLTYDVTSSEIEDFFKDCQVTNVRIVEDKLDHKPKGFGYVEFANLDGLKKALTYSEMNFMGRNVKISIAEPRKLTLEKSTENYQANTFTAKGREESTRDFSDWSRKGPLTDLPQSTRQGSNRGFPSRSFTDNASDAGSERGGGRKGFFEGDNKVRDFSNWERKGPLSPAPGNGPPVRDGGRVREGGPPTERRSSPAWGEGRSDAGSRPPRREFEPARPIVDRAPTAAEQSSQWRSNKPDASPVATPDASTPSSPAPQAPKERPRLNLQKRTVSTAEGEQAASSATDARASPFGAARPVDTAAKEREADEKLQLATRQKKEAEDKAREDKVAKEAAARTARAERADRGQANEDDKVTSPTSESGKGRRTSRQQNGTKPAPKENGETPTQTKPGFSILSREGEGGEEGDEGAEHGQDEDANGSIIDDKETKPQEPVVETTSGAVDAAEPTAQALEEDGWSTVPTSKPKSSRRAVGGRALAS